MGRVMQARNSRKYFSDVVIFFSIMLSAFLKNVEPLHTAVKLPYVTAYVPKYRK